jgi:hypothetical protein
LSVVKPMGTERMKAESRRMIFTKMPEEWKT